ncbi:glutathione S-transferase-like protein, partial [Cylindrobasidium torrendii FP15055 ss-10]
MLYVHHLNKSRSHRILWLLEELGTPYEIKFYYRRQMVPTAPKELKAVHPLGKSPVITDDGGITLPESGAIVEYIIKRHGNGRFATEESEWVDNLYWSHYAEGSLMPPLQQIVVMRILSTRSPWYLRPFLALFASFMINKLLMPALKPHVAMIEERLSNVKWFAGGAEPTSADFDMVFPLEAIVALGIQGKGIEEYVERVHSRPAYKRALEKGGEFTLSY